MPRFLVLSDDDHPDDDQIHQGLLLTAYFLEARIFAPADKALPEPRRRLAEIFQERAAKNSRRESELS